MGRGISRPPPELPNSWWPGFVDGSFKRVQIAAINLEGNADGYSGGDDDSDLDNNFLSYQVMGTWIYIVGFHRRVKVPSVRSILYSTT